MATREQMSQHELQEVLNQLNTAFAIFEKHAGELSADETNLKLKVALVRVDASYQLAKAVHQGR